MGKKYKDKKNPETELSHQGKALVKIVYQLRTAFCALFLAYILLQGEMIMHYYNPRSLLTITTVLIPTYVFVISTAFIIPLILILLNAYTFPYNDIAVFTFTVAFVLKALDSVLLAGKPENTING